MTEENMQTTEALLHDIREDVRSLTQAVTDLIRSIDQRASDSKESLDRGFEDFMRLAMVLVEEWTAIRAEREEESRPT